MWGKIKAILIDLHQLIISNYRFTLWAKKMSPILWLPSRTFWPSTLIFHTGGYFHWSLEQPSTQPFNHDYFRRQLSIRNIENDPQTRDVSVAQRICRFSDENILDVHKYYSYSACSVQCRKDQQLKMCNCTNHLIPNTRKSVQ